MNEIRRIHRSDSEGAGRSAATGSGRRVNTTRSRKEALPPSSGGGRRPAEPPAGGKGSGGKGPKKEKKGHPILRGIFRLFATLFCLGVMAGCALVVCAVFYVVQATANDGDLLNLDSIELSQSSVVVATDPDTGQQVEYATLRSSNSHRM